MNLTKTKSNSSLSYILKKQTNKKHPQNWLVKENTVPRKHKMIFLSAKVVSGTFPSIAEILLHPCYPVISTEYFTPRFR